jgi:AcrR family transcriptional regulator
MQPKPQSQTTRDRVLQAAIEVFAAKGYNQATVRDICARADANVASVSYYFNNKQALYGVVFEHLHDRMIAVHRRPPPDTDLAPIEQLRTFIRSRIEAIFDPSSGGASFSRILSWEMTDPSPDFGRILDTHFVPESDKLQELVSAVAGGELSPFALRASLFSIIGQCIFYHNATQIMEHIAPDFLQTRDLTEQLVDHITTFSAAGLQAVGEASTEVQV